MDYLLQTVVTGFGWARSNRLALHVPGRGVIAHFMYGRDAIAPLTEGCKVTRDKTYSSRHWAYQAMFVQCPRTAQAENPTAP